MAKIIGLHGKKRSGKTTAADFLVEEGFVQLTFGDALKDCLLAIDPFLDGHHSLLDTAPQDRIHGAEVKRLVDTAFEVLSTLTPDRTAVDRSYVTDVVSQQLNPRLCGTTTLAELVGEIGWESAKDHRRYGAEVRHLLQRFGTEVAQTLCGKEVWVRILNSNMADLLDADPNINIVVSDVRFETEAEAVLQRGGVVLEIKRSTLSKPDDAHFSEQQIDTKFVSDTISNDGTLARLRSTMMSVAQYPYTAFNQSALAA